MNPTPTLPRAPAATDGRLHELDALRVIAFGLLILYHVGMYYVRWDFHVKSPHPVPAVEAWMVWSSPWRMSLLFVISGAATALMLGRTGRAAPNAGLGRLAATRSKRLLLPLLFGMAVIVPPQAYLEVVEKLRYGGSYLDFLAKYFQAYQGFCRGDDCLRLPTWNHLWFLPYLWAYTMVALLALSLPGLRHWHEHPGWARVVTGSRLLWAPWLLFVLLRQHLLQAFPTTHDLVHDWYNHALYLSMFVFGLALFGHRDDRHGAWETARRLRWWALALAVASIALFEHLQAANGGAELPEAELMAMRALSAARQWLPIVAALGWARQGLRGCDGPAWRWLTLAVFPFYIVHQTVIIVAAHALAPLGLNQGVEALLLIGITALACLAAAWVSMRVDALRPWMGLGPRDAGKTWHQGGAPVVSQLRSRQVKPASET